MSKRLPTLVLFARAPEPGKVKTRLAPLLTGEGAARLYRGFLEDAARVYLKPELWTSVLAAEPDPEHPLLQSLFPSPWRRIAQAGGDLGERLCAAFEGEAARGAGAVLAVGSDHPALPGERLRRAFEAVAAGADAALIPAEDGGYCAIALSARAAPRAVFRDIPWSSDSVLAVTRTRLAEAGLTVVTLEAAYDVDRPEDIERLRGDIARASPHAPDYPRATARALQELEREGVF
ncbi:MAG TPA: TIGR04282 family arsenosugar biosynthesis glycosyltransferase [Thermoanaerobaculia bacterium]|nr:TIGR04282 family arsenosugar biosynthesis glycosyltransferase [Thermoanaerobaculia bacterium]